VREKRRFRRFKANIEASYTKVQGCATIKSTSTTDDISATGASTALSRIIKKGDDILLELSSCYNDKKIAILAKVVWIRPTKKGLHNRCGLKFLWVSSKAILRDCFTKGGLKQA